MAAFTRRRGRGQVLVLFSVIIALLATAVLFFFNTVMYGTNSRAAMEGSLRAAGLAALHEVDTELGFSRWCILVTDPLGPDATERAREVVSENIGEYAGLFQVDPASLVLDPLGTYAQTQPGLDVEIINPAASSSAIDCDDSTGTLSERAVNEVGATVELCNASYPESVRSELDGNCYDKPTVILSLRLPVTQISGGADTVTVTIAVSAGTDV